MTDLINTMLPVAADLAAAVDNEDAAKIDKLLTSLDRQSLYALAVVLAAHVDVPLVDGRRHPDEVDDVLVLRVLTGDMALAGIATAAERRIVVAKWVADGRTLAELNHLTGWRTDRYRAAQCGTDGGYYRHRRGNREPACEACKAAHRDAERARFARKVGA